MVRYLRSNTQYKKKRSCRVIQSTTSNVMPKSVDIGSKRPEEVKELLAADKPILMLYRMQMCPHCIALQPTWNDVKKRLARDNGLVIAEVEYQYMGLLPSNLRNIRGFPTIHVIEKGKVTDEYNGDRSLDSIVSFAKSHKEIKGTESTKAPAKNGKKRVQKKSP